MSCGDGSRLDDAYHYGTMSTARWARIRGNRLVRWLYNRYLWP